MKKTFLLFTLLIALIGASYALTAGDIAILGVFADTADLIAFVALEDIAEGTVITFTDNPWTAADGPFGTGEGYVEWTCPTGGITKGTVTTLSAYGNIALAADGDQVIAFDGTWANRPTTGNASSFLYAFSLENFITTGTTTSNTSFLPSALSVASVAMTTSATETDNAYFANGADAVTSVTISGTKSELLALFTDTSKYHKNDTRPTLPTYNITVNASGSNAPPSISNITRNPSTDIINTTTVSVSATITDSDGTVTSAQLRWGTTSGTYGNTIGMTASGSTYTTNSNIPAQINGTTVYYVIDATDDDSDTTTSTEQSYEVVAPATTTIPYTQAFTGSFGDTYTYAVSGTKPWYLYNDNATCNGYQSTLEEHWLVLPGINFNNYSEERMTFNTIATYGTIDANNYLKLFYSSNYSGLGDPTSSTWTEISFANGGVGGGETPSGAINLSAITGTNVYLAFKYYSTNSPSRWEVDDINIYLSAAVITVNPTTLTGFTYEYQLGPSAEQSFTVSGADLENDISIDAPANYEISTGTGVSFVATDPITLTQSGGSVATTTIYVRLKAGLDIGTYNSEVINITSSSATGQTVTCSGEVTTPPAPDEPDTDEATGVSESGFTATWNAVGGATGYYLDVYTLVGGGNASDLIISEYIEGGSSNKAIEIYNGTGATVDLTPYTVNLYSNGSPTISATYDLTGTLANGDVFVIAHSLATTAFTSVADVTINGGVVNHNGDDAIALYYDDGTKAAYFVDIFGVIGQDPGASWTASGGLTTVNKTLVRKANVTGGVTVNPTASVPLVTTDFVTLGTEWDMYDQDTASYLGSHTLSAGTLTYVSGYDDLDVGNVTSYPVTGLAPNTTYYYVVRAYNDYGTSGDSEPIDVTTDEDTNPVELASFTATISAQNYITLTWVTQTETGMRGYYIYRDSDSDFAGAQNVSPLIPSTNSSQMQTYMFEDTEVFETGNYFYWLQTNDMDGTVGFHGPVSVFFNALGDNPTPVIPLVTELKAVYPNPFNPTVFIPFSLAKDGNVSFKIYNARGQIVKHFELGSKAAGNYRITWDGTDYHGNALSNGVYQIVMSAGTEVFQTKTTLLK